MHGKKRCLFCLLFEAPEWPFSMSLALEIHSDGLRYTSCDETEKKWRLKKTAIDIPYIRFKYHHPLRKLSVAIHPLRKLSVAIYPLRKLSVAIDFHAHCTVQCKKIQRIILQMVITMLHRIPNDCTVIVG